MPLPEELQAKVSVKIEKINSIEKQIDDLKNINIEEIEKDEELEEIKKIKKEIKNVADLLDIDQKDTEGKIKKEKESIAKEQIAIDGINKDIKNLKEKKAQAINDAEVKDLDQQIESKSNEAKSRGKLLKVRRDKISGNKDIKSELLRNLDDIRTKREKLSILTENLTKIEIGNNAEIEFEKIGVSVLNDMVDIKTKLDNNENLQFKDILEILKSNLAKIGEINRDTQKKFDELDKVYSQTNDEIDKLKEKKDAQEGTISQLEAEILEKKDELAQEKNIIKKEKLQEELSSKSFELKENESAYKKEDYDNKIISLGKKSAKVKTKRDKSKDLLDKIKTWKDETFDPNLEQINNRILEIKEAELAKSSPTDKTNNDENPSKDKKNKERKEPSTNQPVNNQSFTNVPEESKEECESNELVVSDPKSKIKSWYENIHYGGAINLMEVLTSRKNHQEFMQGLSHLSIKEKANLLKDIKSRSSIDEKDKEIYKERLFLIFGEEREENINSLVGAVENITKGLEFSTHRDFLNIMDFEKLLTKKLNRGEITQKQAEQYNHMITSRINACGIMNGISKFDFANIRYAIMHPKQSLQKSNLLKELINLSARNQVSMEHKFGGMNSRDDKLNNSGFSKNSWADNLRELTNNGPIPNSNYPPKESSSKER